MKKLSIGAVRYNRLAARWIAFTFFLIGFVAALPFSAPAQPETRRLNNLTALLLEAAPTRGEESFSFTRPRDGWIFISATTRGEGEARLALDSNERDTILLSRGSGAYHEAMTGLFGQEQAFNFIEIQPYHEQDGGLLSRQASKNAGIPPAIGIEHIGIADPFPERVPCGVAPALVERAAHDCFVEPVVIERPVNAIE